MKCYNNKKLYTGSRIERAGVGYACCVVFKRVSFITDARVRNECWLKGERCALSAAEEGTRDKFWYDIEIAPQTLSSMGTRAAFPRMTNNAYTCIKV